MAYKFVDLIREVLEKENCPMTPADIWKKAVELNYHEKLPSYGKTPDKTIGAVLYTVIKQDGDESIFVQASKRPVKFSLRNNETDCTINDNDCTINNNDCDESSDPSVSKSSYRERDLHIFLSSFVYSNSHFQCYTKTIYHERSKKTKKNKNEWLHPDIVGVRYPFNDFNQHTIEFMKATQHNNCKLFSFEIKKRLSFDNLRECYFQAVSNSSWANEGYLVAVEIDPADDFIDELRRLNNAFGIGIIRLCLERYTESEILLPAHEHTLDWNTINRLCEDNDDFRAFAHTISSDLNIREIRNEKDFDPFFSSEEEAIEYINKNKMTIK